jgi:hypothetical protein
VRHGGYFVVLAVVVAVVIQFELLGRCTRCEESEGA